MSLKTTYWIIETIRLSFSGALLVLALQGILYMVTGWPAYAWVVGITTFAGFLLVLVLRWVKIL